MAKYRGKEISVAEMDRLQAADRQSAIDAGYADFNEWKAAGFKDTEKVTANKKLASDNVKLSDMRQGLMNFDKSYKPFEYDKNNPYLQGQRRLYQQQESETGRELSKALASRGAKDSGQATRSLQQNKMQTYAKNIATEGQDYLRQYQQYGQEKAGKLQQKYTMYGLENEASKQVYEQAMSNYYQQLAIDQQNALNSWQMKQQEQSQGWDIFSNILQTAGGIGLGIAGIATANPLAAIGGFTTAAKGVTGIAREGGK